MIKNAIILSGGTGTRLQPLTHVVNKHLLGVNGKFILDYPIDTLRKMGVENLTVVMGGNHFSQVVDHLQDGRAHGVKCNYVYQGEARGIAQAINLCQRYVSDEEEFVVILGDNIYSNPIPWNIYSSGRARIVLHKHPELQRFGVASIDRTTGALSKIEEKPLILEPEYYHQYAITGCYLFDQRFFTYFQDLVPSARGEYEITDIITAYHRDDALDYTWVDGFWSDAGTHASVALCNQYFYNLSNP